MHFEFEQTIPQPIETVFTFHQDPAHLSCLYADWTAFRMICHDARLQQGCQTWFEISVSGILPIVMGFENIMYEPPHRFGEKLIHGPFVEFTHIHEFDEMGSNTMVRDLLDVRLPWQYGGEATMKLFVARALRRAFAHRNKELYQLAKSGDMAQGSA